MPIIIRHLPHSRMVRVYENKKVIAKRTTMKKAESLVRLQHGLEHGMIPRKRK